MTVFDYVSTRTEGTAMKIRIDRETSIECMAYKDFGLNLPKPYRINGFRLDTAEVYKAAIEKDYDGVRKIFVYPDWWNGIFGNEK